MQGILVNSPRIPLRFIRATSLGEVIKRLNTLDRDLTIYVKKPWNLTAKAIVAREPETGGLPKEASANGLEYFLEVSIAQELLSDWLKSQQAKPSLEKSCERLIHYAEYDA